MHRAVPEKPIYDIPGLPVVTGQGLIDNLLDQIKPFDPVFHHNQLAESLQKLDNGNWLLTTSDGVNIEAPVVVVAAGGGSFTPKRPPISGIEDYEGTSVFYSVRKMENFRHKKLLIAGGGDSALDWTVNLQPVADQVTLVHRRDQFRAAPDSVKKMFGLRDEGKINLKWGRLKNFTVRTVSLKASPLRPKKAIFKLNAIAYCLSLA